MEEKTGRKASNAEEEGKGRGRNSNMDVVTIKVQMAGLEDVDVRMKRDLLVSRLIRTYCDHMRLRRDSLRFTLAGRRIQETHTPNDLNIQDGDVIDVWSDHSGGGGSRCF